MKPPAFEYFAPTDIDGALALMAAHGEDARFLAGGQSLVPMLNLRLAAPAALIDLNGVAGLGEVVIDNDGTLNLGAMTRTRRIETDPAIVAANPLLSHAAASIAHVQIRNRGTIGGSLAHADPAAELPGLVLACDAEIHLQSPSGTRTVAAAEFFDGVFSTAVADGEMIVRIVFPAWPNARRWGFREVSRRDGDFAMVGIAGWYDLDSRGRIETVRLAAIGAGDTAVRLLDAEAALTGNAPADDVFAAAATAAMEELRPGDDLHASAAYRREVGGVLVGRVLGDARDRRT